MNFRFSKTPWILLATLACLVPLFCAADDTRPNFVIIVSDDQRFGTVGKFMPNTQAEIFDSGVTFSRGYVTTPACCPSRASIFTGMYASSHETIVNRSRLTRKTVYEYLDEAGYYNGLVGKYLNTWNGTPRGEFDYWASFKGGSSGYTRYRLNENGRWRNYSETYITDTFADHAVQFLRQAAAQDKPFALHFTPNAPHRPFIAKAQDRRRWRNERFETTENFNRGYDEGKPSWVLARNNSARFQGAARKLFRQTRKISRAQLAMLWSLDEAVGDIVDELDRLDLRENTVLVFISDNGLMYGEHRLSSKDCVYEQAIRVPYALSYPALYPQPQIVESLAANIDIAPTMLALAGVPIPSSMDGEDLTTVISGESPREHLLIEGFRTKGPRNPFTALHTGRYVFVQNRNDITELYDLETDPSQVENLSGNPAHAQTEANLKGDLLELVVDVRKPGSAGHKVFPPSSFK